MRGLMKNLHHTLKKSVDSKVNMLVQITDVQTSPHFLDLVK